MNRAEQNIDMMNWLYDCRRAARGILGDSYAATLTPWREFIRRVMQAKGLSTLPAALDIGKHVEPHDGLSLMLVFAAGVELIESPALTNAIDPTDGSDNGMTPRENASSPEHKSLPEPQEPT